MPGFNPVYFHLGDTFIIEIGARMESSALMEDSEPTHPLINQLSK